MKYRVLKPELVSETFEKVKVYLPDVIKNPMVFNNLYWAKDSMFFEVGLFQGVFWLSNIVVGHRATAHVVLWDKEAQDAGLKSTAIPGRIIRYLFQLLDLKRLEAYIPVMWTRSCEWAERLGLTLEGVLKQHTLYDGKATDVAAYALTKEELDGQRL